MISRKPRHFACIIHSNSPVRPTRPNQPPRPKRSRSAESDHFVAFILLRGVLLRRRQSRPLAVDVGESPSECPRTAPRHSRSAADVTPRLSASSFNVHFNLYIYRANICRRICALRSRRRVFSSPKRDILLPPRLSITLIRNACVHIDS